MKELLYYKPFYSMRNIVYVCTKYCVNQSILRGDQKIWLLYSQVAERVPVIEHYNCLCNANNRNKFVLFGLLR